MEKEEIQVHLDRILNDIAEITQITQAMSLDEFQREEQVKESLYSLLQEIGQAAHEVEMANPERFDLSFDLDVLASFRNARYNQEAELDHQSTWHIIQNELPERGAQLEQSQEYLR